MKRACRSLIILCALVIAMITLIEPPPARADWGECDADFQDRTAYCSQQNADCIWSRGTNCELKFNACLDQSGTLRTTCINETDPTPQPWPVIDNSRSLCIEGCSTPCGEIPDSYQRMACRVTCYHYCNEIYPR